MDEDIVAKKGDGLGEYRIVVVEDGGDDPLIEDGIRQDVDQEDFSLGNWEAEEGDGDLVGRGVWDQGHGKMEE